VKRAAYIFAVLSLLIIADGVYLDVSNNQQGCGCNGDSGSLFGGSTSINLSTGTEVLIGGGLLLIVTGIVWIVAMRRDRGLAAANGRTQASPAQAGQAQAANAQAGQAQAAKAQAGQSPPKTEVTAGQAQAASAQAGQSPAKTEVTAGQSQVVKETGDQL
jgi:hypothetical protein